MPRIYWDDEDRAKIARETSRIMRATGLGTLSAVQQAQHVLKPEKRRNITSMAAVPWLPAEIESQKQLMEADTRREAELAAAREEGARAARENLTPGMLWPMLQGHIVSMGSNMLKEMFLTVLRDTEVRDALGDMFSPQAFCAPADTSVPTAAGSSSAPTAPAELTQSAARLAKVVILGLLPGQQNTIRREFQHRFNLEFLEADSSHTQMRQHAQNAEFIFGMRFINHSDEHQVTSTARDRYMRIEGGLTRLREALAHVHEHRRLPLHAFRAVPAMAH